MKSITKFKALYCPGFFIPKPAAITAMSLLFEKIFLPNNIVLIREFSRKFRITKSTLPPLFSDTTIEITCAGKPYDPFEDLSPMQRDTAFSYINVGMFTLMAYAELFGEVFESNLFEGGNPNKVKLHKKGKSGKNNTYISGMCLCETDDEEKEFCNMIEKGYIPLVCKITPFSESKKHLQQNTIKELAALLAMKSIEMILPNTKAARADVILEARDKLKNHLPPFWSSMLKMSVQLKEAIKNSKTTQEVVREGQDIVDSIVRPALVDLNSKLEKERKQWFYKILSPLQKGLRLTLGNPPLSQQQLIANSLIMGSDIIMDTARNIQAIEALKKQAGLTFLLELDKIVSKNKSLTNQSL